MTIRRVKDPEKRGRKCYKNQATEIVYCGGSALQHALHDESQTRKKVIEKKHGR